MGTIAQATSQMGAQVVKSYPHPAVLGIGAAVVVIGVLSGTAWAVNRVWIEVVLYAGYSPYKGKESFYRGFGIVAGTWVVLSRNLYLPLLLAALLCRFVRTSQYTPEQFRDLLWNGYAFPENVIVNGNLEISEGRSTPSWPTRLHVKGDLFASKLQSWPESFVVDGTSTLYACLPDKPFIGNRDIRLCEYEGLKKPEERLLKLSGSIEAKKQNRQVVVQLVYASYPHALIQKILTLGGVQDQTGINMQENGIRFFAVSNSESPPVKSED